MDQVLNILQETRRKMILKLDLELRLPPRRWAASRRLPALSLDAMAVSISVAGAKKLRKVNGADTVSGRCPECTAKTRRSTMENGLSDTDAAKYQTRIENASVSSILGGEMLVRFDVGRQLVICSKPKPTFAPAP